MEQVLGWDRARTSTLLQACEAELTARLRQIQAVQSIRSNTQLRGSQQSSEKRKEEGVEKQAQGGNQAETLPEHRLIRIHTTSLGASRVGFLPCVTDNNKTAGIHESQVLTLCKISKPLECFCLKRKLDDLHKSCLSKTLTTWVYFFFFLAGFLFCVSCCENNYR